MRTRIWLATIVLLLSATAFGHDADWWYAKYQKLGHTNPKWDSLVREGIDHWMAAHDPKAVRNAKLEMALSVQALERAYAAGCRCPIALFIDAVNIMQTSGDGTIVFDRFNESIKRTENRPELAFVRIPCANALGRRYMNGGEHKLAIPYLKIALSLQSPDVDEGVIKEAMANLKEAEEKVAAQEKQRAGLDVLTLPADPTREQVRAYVRQVLFLAPENTWARSGDPEVAMLEKVGHRNLDVILETWRTTGVQSRAANYYAHAAVWRLARVEHKPLLMKWLPFHTEIVELMMNKGWVQDMRPFLLERVTERSTHLELPILRAAAQLRDPATYGDLVWHFENNQNGINIYDDIRNLPGIELKDAVLRVWAASKSWKGWEADRRYIAAAAAMDYGASDALQFAVEQLASAPPTQWIRETLRKGIRERTGLRGSDDEIRTWFQTNKDKIVFDEESRMFRPGK